MPFLEHEVDFFAMGPTITFHSFVVVMYSSWSYEYVVVTMISAVFLTTL